MGFLTEPITDRIISGGKRYRVTVAYDTVLTVQRLFQEDELDEGIKLDQALKMFGIRHGCRIGIQQSIELLSDIYSHCINIKQRPVHRQNQPVFDFEEDGEFIYSSFRMDYGIDLIDMQGRLHWKRFIALFQGLSERTKIREVIRIRSMKVPRYDGHNQEQIREIQELKSYYALPVRGGGGAQGLDALFSALEAQTERNESYNVTM